MSSPEFNLVHKKVLRQVPPTHKPSLEEKVHSEKQHEFSPANYKWYTGATEDIEPESHEYVDLPSNADWGSGELQDNEPELDEYFDLLSNTNLHSGAPQDIEPDSDEDVDSPSNTDLGSGGRQDIEPESDEDVDSLSNTDYSGVKQDIEPESDEDVDSLSYTDYSGIPQGNEPESDEDVDSLSYTDYSGVPQGNEPESDEDVDSLSYTDYNGVPQDIEPESGEDVDLPPHTEWGSGAPHDIERESDEYDWYFADPQDIEPESDVYVHSSTNAEFDSVAPHDMDSQSLKPGMVSSFDNELESGEEPNIEQSNRSSKVTSESPSAESNRNAFTSMELALEQMLGQSNKERLPLNEPSAEDADKADRSSAKGRRSSPEYPGSGFDQENSERNTKMNSTPEPYALPASDIRWTGLSLAHRSHDDAVVSADEAKKKNNEQGAGGISTAVITFFVIGGLFLLLLMVAFFIFAWPIRKYYAHLLRRMDNKDAESGQYEDDELMSIRVDPSCNPSEGGSTAYYPPTQQDPTSTPYQAPYQAPVVEHSVTTTPNRPVAGEQPRFGIVSHSQIAKAKSTPDQSGERSTAQVLSEDKTRDSRNVERRRIIKHQTFQRRHSLADSITIAKTVLDGHAKNKQFEKKASERRRVIKCCRSAPGSVTGERRMSFEDELQTACSVIAPAWDYKESVERSKEKCRTIKEQFSCKRRPSLLEEIGVAKDVIVDSERRKYEIPPAVVEEMMIAQMAPGGPMKCYEEVLDKLIRENSEYERVRAILRNEPPTSAEEQQSMVENEILWDGETTV